MGLQRQGHDRGYAMAALLVSLAVMSVVMSALLPAWRFQARREKEAELVFRGEQYARAIGLFARRNGGALPPNLDVLVQGRYIRKKFTDPMTKDGEFQPLFAGANQPVQSQPGFGGRSGQGSPGRIGGRGGPVPPVQSGGVVGGVVPGLGGNPGQMTGPGGLIGVVSKSKEASIRIYRGGTKYNEWVFRYAGLQNQPGAAPGQVTPGMPGMVPPGGGRGRGRGGATFPGGMRPGGPGFPGGRGTGRGLRPPG